MRVESIQRWENCGLEHLYLRLFCFVGKKSGSGLAQKIFDKLEKGDSYKIANWYQVQMQSGHLPHKLTVFINS